MSDGFDGWLIEERTVMGISTTRAQRRQLERDNAKQPTALCEVPREQWPAARACAQLRVLRSRDFLVQEFAATAPAVVRLSVCRTKLDGDRWQEGISWDELQRLKRECGYGNADAIEVFPADADVVNVANMRHLWVMAEPVVCAWRKPSNVEVTGAARLYRAASGGLPGSAYTRRVATAMHEDLCDVLREHGKNSEMYARQLGKASRVLRRTLPEILEVFVGYSSSSLR